MRTSLGRLYLWIITNKLSNRVAQIAVIKNTGKAPKGMVKRMDKMLKYLNSAVARVDLRFQ